jgi:predicted RNA-binding Zn ribbon-like protein
VEKATSKSEEKRFQLVSGHPALDFVNTLDWRFRDSGPEELLRNYADVIRFTEQSRLTTPLDARRLLRGAPENKAENIVAAIHALRESTAEVLYAVVDGKSPSSSSLRRLEACFNEAGAQQQLHWEGTKLEWKLPKSPAPAMPYWLLSLSVAQFMTSDQMQLLRACDSPECRWLFLDTSKNHTRRWCDMKICGNRMKARRFKAQLRTEAAQHGR